METKSTGPQIRREKLDIKLKIKNTCLLVEVFMIKGYGCFLLIDKEGNQLW
jgi:hypothetical protein